MPSENAQNISGFNFDITDWKRTGSCRKEMCGWNLTSPESRTMDFASPFECKHCFVSSFFQAGYLGLFTCPFPAPSVVHTAGEVSFPSL